MGKPNYKPDMKCNIYDQKMTLLGADCQLKKTFKRTVQRNV